MDSNDPKAGPPGGERPTDVPERKLGRFREKISGNPSGRRPGSKNLKTIFKAVANERRASTVDGKREVRTILEFVSLALKEAMLDGNKAAAKKYEHLCQKYGLAQSDDEVGYIFIDAEPLTREEFIRKHARPEDLEKMTPERWEHFRNGGY